MLESFPKSAAVIVHGASRGIGLALARKLVESNHFDSAFFTCRDPDSAIDLRNLQRSSPDRISLLKMDATDEEAVSSAATYARQKENIFGLIINCFGALHDDKGLWPEKKISEVTAETLLRSFSVNAVGHALVAKHFTPAFPEQAHCVFASLSARVGSIGDNRLGGWYAYRASKAAQNMITKGLSVELPRRKKGLICVALHPGTTDTALSEPFTQRTPEARLFSPELAAHQLLTVIDSLAPKDNGGFFAWDGKPISW
jgi:NAD(P)-dependent dehydrogenase (short-subunit alcohol dehydrogenase family)